MTNYWSTRPLGDVIWGVSQELHCMKKFTMVFIRVLIISFYPVLFPFCLYGTAATNVIVSTSVVSTSVSLTSSSSSSSSGGSTSACAGEEF